MRCRQVELPARFIWRTYRQILGKQAVPQRRPWKSAADVAPYALAACLPARARLCPIANYLRAEEPERLLQLAERLADLFDQYQIYRADWLQAWEAGHDVLPNWASRSKPCPLVSSGNPCCGARDSARPDGVRKAATRTALQALVLRTLREAPPASVQVASRVVLFAPQPCAAGHAGLFGCTGTPHPSGAGRAQPVPLPLGRCRLTGASCCACSAAASR